MLAGFSKVGGSLVGIGSAAAAIAASVRLIRKEFERLKAVDTGAFTAQATLNQVVAKFVVNNPQTSAADISKFKAQAREAGRPLGAGGGALAFGALMALRGQTPGASSEDQIAAIRVAAKLKAMDPDIDMASFSANAIKLQESARRGGQELTTDQAFKTMLFTGSRAGGDISELSSAMIRLTGAEGLATGNDLQELLSLFAFGTAETGDVTGKPTASTVSTLLTRMMTRPLKVDGQEIEMVGDTGLDKLINMVERIRAGEFEDPAKVIKALSEGGGDTMAIGLIQQLVAKLDRFLVTKGAITATRIDTDIGRELQEKAGLVSPGFEEQLGAQKTAADTSAAFEDMSREARRKIAMGEVESLRLAHKVGTFEGPFFGGLGFGHSIRTAEDINRDRGGEEILDFGQRQVTGILARRLLYGREAADVGIKEVDPSRTREEDNRVRAIRNEIRNAEDAARPLEKITEIVARHNLISPHFGISKLESDAMKLQGKSQADITALNLVDVGPDRHMKLHKALDDLTEKMILLADATGNATGQVDAEGEFVTTTTPTTVAPVPIDANDL